jgi:ABC-type bacteriocin/lantibiotic exporter with double-glycine peptidase domain
VTGVLSTIPVLGALAARLAQILESHRLLAITGLLAVAFVLRGGTQLGSQILSVFVPLRLHCAIVTRCYDALVDADLAYMPEREFGELQALREHPQRAGAVLGDLLTVLVSIILVVIFGLLMYFWQMTLAAVMFVAMAHLIM